MGDSPHRVTRLRRRRLLQLGIVGSGAFALGPLLAACAPSGSPTAPAAGAIKRGGSLRVALDSDIVGIDPHGASAGVDRNVYTSVYNALVSVDTKLNIIPDLAESWTNPDDATYVFKLRQNVKFHDGTPCDAAAVKYNFDWMLDPANASARRAELADIKEVSVVDALTVKITTKAAFAPFLAIIADRAGYIVSPDARKKFGKDFTRNPVGTGPFRFVEWVKDDHVTFKRNPDYFEPNVPILDEIVYKSVPDATVRVTGLKAGDTDFLYRVDAKDIADAKGQPTLQVFDGPGVGYTGLWLQTATGPLASRDLREAIAWAIDRESILKAAYFNVGQVAQGPVPPSLFAHDPAFKPFTRDLTKAKAALAKGGQPNGFKMLLKTPNESVASKVSQLVQAQLKEVGIEVEIQTLEFGALLKAGEQGQFDAMTLGWSGRIDPDGNIQPIFHTKGTFNYGKYKGADALIDEARSTLDKEKRKALYRQIEKKVAQDDVAYIFTYFLPTIFPASKRVQGFDLNPDGLMRFKRTSLT